VTTLRATSAAITGRFAAAARAAGWTLRRITLYRPAGLAAAVTLVAAHPHGFGRQLAEFVSPGRHAGVLTDGYFESHISGISSK
jgi:hypothetical protein